jgi:hypothetical protein
MRGAYSRIRGLAAEFLLKQAGLRRRKAAREALDGEDRSMAAISLAGRLRTAIEQVADGALFTSDHA